MKPLIVLRTLLATALLTTVTTAVVIAADKPAKMAAETFATMATVQDIDQKTRQVTLRDPDGNMTTFVAGPEVKNLPQVKKGDLVLMEYYEGLAIAVGPKGTGLEARKDEVVAEAGVPGEKPALSVTRTVDAIAKVTAIDRTARVVTLQGAERTIRLKVQDDVDLKTVDVGDEVVARYIAGFAIRVVPAPKVSGRITAETKSIAVGIGVGWGEGELTMYDGSKHKLKIGGVSIVDVGVSKSTFTGEVFELTDPKDIEGVYASAAAGITLGKGRSAAVLKNDRGVVMRVISEQTGLKLTLAPEGIKIELVE